MFEFNSFGIWQQMLEDCHNPMSSEKVVWDSGSELGIYTMLGGLPSAEVHDWTPWSRAAETREHLHLREDPDLSTNYNLETTMLSI